MFRLIIILFALLLNLMPVCALEEGDYIQEVGEVLETTKPEFISETDSYQQIVKIKICKTGKCEEHFLTNFVPTNQAFRIIAEKHKKYLVAIEDGVDQVYLSDYYREPTIIWLLIAFALLTILIGGFTGFKALVCLILTGLALVYFLIPGIKAGYDPITLAVLLSIFATAIVMISIAGFSKKSLAATIGTTGGVTVSGLIATLVIHTAPLSGIASQEAFILLANLGAQKLNFQGILAAGILIASLGAAVDVAVSVASAAQEIYETDPTMSKRKLFMHTMKVGKDIMGTMVDTLILAYAGSSMPLFLLLHGDNHLRLLNMEIIATEIASAVSGSIGLILAIPITATVSAILLKGFTKKICIIEE